MKQVNFDFVEMVERIHTDRLHGASWLAREAARDLAIAANGSAGTPEERLVAAHSLAHSLALARPSMAAIAMTVARVWAATIPFDRNALAQLEALGKGASAIEESWRTALSAMTAWTRQMLATTNGAVYTLSRSHTVEGVLTAVAREQSRTAPLRIIVSESRPGSEGIMLARTLAEAGAEVTLAPDAACATLMEEAALVFVGADAIRADGAIVNKVGTRSLALAAQALGKPVYALAESLKVVAPSYPMELQEFASIQMLAQPIDGVKERNPVFDITPASLITAVVTESGAMNAPAIQRLAEQAEKAYIALMSD